MSTIAQTVQMDLASAAYSNGGVLASPVTQSANTTPALVDQAARLSEQGSAVVSLSGGSSSAATTYNAAGLLNSFTQAGTLQGGLLTANSAASAASTAQQSTEQDVVNATLGGTPSSLTGSSAAQSTTEGIVSQVLGGSSATTTLNNQWAQLLQTHPELAGQAAQNIENGSVVNALA
jgi:hypothetical protein